MVTFVVTVAAFTAVAVTAFVGVVLPVLELRLATFRRGVRTRSI
jgi:predicted benzoate:H+ symporter BenE